jgi:uncharacterized protein (DUF433 family)
VRLGDREDDMATEPTLRIEEMTDEELEDSFRYHRVLDWEQRIHTDPNIAFGKPVVRWTRLAAEFILELYATGWTDEMVLESYPHLTVEDIRAVFAYAAECVSEKQVEPVREPSPTR